MKRVVFGVQCSVFCILIQAIFGSSLLAQESSPVRFCAVDIYLDAGSTPLAAYQVDFSITNGVGKIVGIEGGEHQAFRSAPHYDPKAIQNEHVIIAAFSLLPANGLPSGRTRVATVHLMIHGYVDPKIEVRVQVAGDVQGNKFAAVATVEKKETK